MSKQARDQGPWPQSRVRLRIARLSRLRALLRKVVRRYFFGSVLAAARYAGIPQPTLWRVLKRGQTLIEARTRSRLRVLLPDLDDETWEDLFLTRWDRHRLERYEKAISAEIKAHATAYGMTTEDQIAPPLSPAAMEQLERFWRWGIHKGHHPDRMRLAVWRIRAPFFLGRFSEGVEPDARALRDEGARDVRVVELGINREKLLLRHVPAPLVELRAP